MASTAASMARDNDINLIVFDITKKDALINALDGKDLQTKVIK